MNDAVLRTGTKSSIDGTTKYVVLSLTLIPLWWVLGAGVVVFHLAALLVVLRRPRCLVPASLFQVWLLLLIALLSLSLVVFLFEDATEVNRLVGAFNNISILGVGYCFFSFFRHGFARDTQQVVVLSKKLGWLSKCSFALGGVAVFALVVMHASEVSFPTALGLITPKMDNLIGLYQRADLVAIDWFSESSVPRLTVLSANPTSSAALVAIGWFIVLGAISAKSNWRALLGFFAISLIVAATLTRGAMAGIALGLLLWLFLIAGPKLRFSIIPLVPLVIVGLLATASDGLDRANSAREASSETRLASYRMSYEVTMDQSPVIGLGIKPRVDNLVIPLGSHSTVLSTLVRGGLLGLMLGLTTFFLLPAIWAARIVWKVITRSTAYGRLRPFAIAVAAGLPSYLVYALLQDIDAYAPLSALIFSYLAVLHHFSSGGLRGGK